MTASQTRIKERILYLLQSLQFTEEERFRVIQCINSGDYPTALMLLRRTRLDLLKRLHASQQALDDLDLLVYEIRKIGN